MSDNESANTNVAYTSLPHDEATATESLLHESRNGARASGLPKLQMLAYAGIRSSEPFMFVVLMPFINELIVEYGIANDPRSTGYAAGMLETAVWVANASMIMPWVYISDTYGRRPVLLGTTFVCTVMGLLVGFPKSYGALLLLRFLAGFWNGQSAVAKTYLSELVDESNQASAFAIQSLAWQSGWSLAGIAGAYLSHPERNFPSLADNSFGKDYPYALGPLVSSIVPLCAVILGCFIMKETLPPGGFHVQLKMNNDMWSALLIWCNLVSCNISFMATLPLFMFAPVSAGGLGLSMVAIGWYFAIRAAIIICVEFPIYPRLHRRFGHGKMLRGQITLYPILFALFPLTSMSRRYFGGESLDAFTVTLLGILTVVESLAQTVFISGDLLCTNAAPSQELQSKYNAVIEAIAKLGQLVFTWAASWLFAISAETQIFGGYLIWVVLIAVASFGMHRCFKLEEVEGWRKKQNPSLVSPGTPMTPYSSGA